MVFRHLIRRMSDLSCSLRPRQSELADAKPIDENWRFTKHFDVEAEYPHIWTQHKHQGQRVDGLWVCHCSQENELKHYAGPNPFKRLVCEKCMHVFCGRCQTSEILTRISVETNEVFSSRFQRARNESYCSICTHCGLSHRAKMSGGCLDFSARCLCGHKEKNGAHAFFIGSSYEYRRNPETKAVAVRIQGYIKTNEAVCGHGQQAIPAPAPRRGSAPASVSQTVPPPMRTFQPTPTREPAHAPRRGSKPQAAAAHNLVPAPLRVPMRAPRPTTAHALIPVGVPLLLQDSAHSQGCKKHIRPPPQVRASTAPAPVHTIDLLEDAWAGARTRQVRQAPRTGTEFPTSRLRHAMSRPVTSTGSAGRQPQYTDRPAASLEGRKDSSREESHQKSYQVSYYNQWYDVMARLGDV